MHKTIGSELAYLHVKTVIYFFLAAVKEIGCQDNSRMSVSLWFSLCLDFCLRERETHQQILAQEKETKDGLVAALRDFQIIPPKVTLVI